MTEGEQLTAWRKELGWNQEEAAHFLGYHVRHYSELEAGRRSVQLAAFKLLESQVNQSRRRK